MTTTTEPVEHTTRRERTWVYVTAVVLLVIGVVWALAVFRTARETTQSQQKADELIAAIEAEGGQAPSQDQIVRVLGDDGGATCADPNAALSRATLFAQMANGATGPGIRPVLAPRTVVEGQLLIIQVYCPEELEEFQQLVDDLRFSDEGDG